VTDPRGLGPFPVTDYAHDDHDPLLRALGRLAVEPPPTFDDRVISGWVVVPGPVGQLFVAFSPRGVSYVRLTRQPQDDVGGFLEDFRRRFGRPVKPADRPPAGLGTAVRTGRSAGLDFDLGDSSEFERAVLRKAMEIPRGEIRPYAWIAREIGRPRAVRAVGSALGHNPVPILVPCHRVVLSDGQVGNYAMGPELKRQLLTTEQVDLAEAERLAAAGVHYLASDTTGVVCYPTCHHARRIMASHRVTFRTMARALDEGYRPCQDCRPALAETA
jgi:methylated-DNA-[protein]-cysteine S-methyltransferase